MGIVHSTEKHLKGCVLKRYSCAGIIHGKITNPRKNAQRRRLSGTLIDRGFEATNWQIFQPEKEKREQRV